MKDFLSDIHIKMQIAKAKATVFIKQKVEGITPEHASIYRKCLTTALCLFVFTLFVSVMLPAFNATYNVDVSGTETKYKDLFNGIYAVCLPVFTIIAVTLIGYNILVIMSSKNQKKIDTAYTWIKAIAISWLCLALAGVVINFARQVFREVQNADASGHVSGPLFEYDIN